MEHEPPRRLVVNADDFGASESINRAVLHAHCHGILTSASLMVNGPAFQQAVEMARAHPALGVGLHLVLVCGASALSRETIPGLVDPEQRFSDSPVACGVRYFFQRSLRPQLAAEMEAQFAKFQETGLLLDHVNGHLNMHLHPTVFSLLMQKTSQWGIRRVRLTSDPLGLNLRLAKGKWIDRLMHALIFRILSSRARQVLRDRGIVHTDRVFGLLQNGAVDERFLLALLENLPAGSTELYSHPSDDTFKSERDALVSPVVKQRVSAQNILLTRYQDLL